MAVKKIKKVEETPKVMQKMFLYRNDYAAPTELNKQLNDGWKISQISATTQGGSFTSPVCYLLLEKAIEP